MEENITSVKQKVRQYILSETYADKTKISDDTLIFKEGYFDSIGFVRIISFIEEIFRIKVDDADMVEENFKSINAISKFVLNRSI